MDISNFLRSAAGAMGVDIEPCSAYAYLPFPTGNTIAEANTYQALAGIFANVILENWIYGDNDIIYIGSVEKYVHISGNWSLTTDTNTNTITLAVRKNGELIPVSPISRLVKLVTDIASWSGICTTLVMPGDHIQIVIMSDKLGSIVTVEQMQLSLSQRRHMIQ